MDLNQQRYLRKSVNSSFINSSKVCLYSPRQHLQRKPQLNFPNRKKRIAQKNLKEVFCYISPSRQQKHCRTDSDYIEPEIKTSFEMKNKENTRASINTLVSSQQPKSPKFQMFEKIKKPDNLTELQYQNDKFRQENNVLKSQNVELIKQMNLMSCLKDKAQKELVRVEGQLKQKEIQMRQFKQQKEKLMQLLEKEKENLELKEQSFKYLQQVVVPELQQVVRGIQKQPNWRQQKQRHQRFDWEINELRQNLKYYGIENSILKKKNLQHQKQKIQLEKLKDQNKKLLNKIDDLSRMKQRFLSAKCYDPIFELSPEKQ